MRVGLDVFTIRELNLTPYQKLDFAAERGFEGVQFEHISTLSEALDAGALRAVRAYADEKGLYTHVSVSPVNPVTSPLGFDGLAQSLERQIAAAAAAGWRELHSVINCGSERYAHPVPWSRHVEGAIQLINHLRPTLEKYGARIDIETHGETTFDVLKVIECTGTHLTGVCLDTANTLCNAEDPVLAARRVAPYTHLTHTKDGLVSFCESGVIRQGKAPGMGSVDFRQVLPILGRYSPDLPLSIEDHKWLFTADIFDEEWMAKNPELTPHELAVFVRLAWEGRQRLDRGEAPPIEEYEAVPYLAQMEERLASGRDYLRALLDELGLRNDAPGAKEDAN